MATPICQTLFRNLESLYNTQMCCLKPCRTNIRLIKSLVRRYLHNKHLDKNLSAVKGNQLPAVIVNHNLQRTRKYASSSPIKRQEPGVVRLGFVPEEWFTAFFPKTGVTGLATLTFTVSTLLISKEYYVLEHEYYGALSMGMLCVLAVKNVGPMMAEWLDSEVDQFEKGWMDERKNNLKFYENGIADEQNNQKISEGQLLLVEAKRENVALQLEAAYRERLMTAYTDVKKRLDACAEIEAAERAFRKRYIVSWISREVGKALDDEIKDMAMKQAMKDLEHLGKTFKGLSETPYPEATISEVDELPTPPPPPKTDKKKGGKK